MAIRGPHPERPAPARPPSKAFPFQIIAATHNLLAPGAPRRHRSEPQGPVLRGHRKPGTHPGRFSPRGNPVQCNQNPDTPLNNAVSALTLLPENRPAGKLPTTQPGAFSGHRAAHVIQLHWTP